ncbi:molybdenum ABC transporter ATP-binding protein [Fulvimarina sp. 2208YS6-2-32]|uniref:Molybdenum ABC transporter ATP-binding protein n=1 Tax=Fulvimarina uroteuthidis TaxID=3098149 RepID=A0ABU5I429_9HYPH|nr:molybdenum ABC transporter ATP-binding protein [Fulvimarina sp. 2208YS6-2-32]MDY8109840.1 molybdenum ABC transporter ATP-binding protein [Fulvimarina sp. 2208YS6-2-32]
MQTSAQSIMVNLEGRLGSFMLDVAFQAPMRGITALFGPSGCGKTTILRSVAGLRHIPGAIAIGTDVWQNSRSFRPPHERPVGYVFQEPSLFPHLSVRRNLVYGRDRAAGSSGAIRFDDVVDLLGLSHLVDRDPAHLSGGERQRVSIGRALLSQPRLLLMDEPLSALDRMAKDEILPYFEALHANLSIPVLLVTHDIAEVERLADHLVVLKDGRVVHASPLNEALTDPNLPFGRSRDFAAVLAGTVTRVDPDGLAAIDVFGTEILAIGDGLDVNQTVRVRIVASDVSLARDRATQSSILNLVPARIVGIDPMGAAEANVRLSLATDGSAHFVARVSRRSVASLDLRADDRVVAQIKSVSLAATR